jgi:hypothetical protein
MSAVPPFMIGFWNEVWGDIYLDLKSQSRTLWRLTSGVASLKEDTGMNNFVVSVFYFYPQREAETMNGPTRWVSGHDEGLCNCVCATVELVPLVYTTVQYLVRLHKIATPQKVGSQKMTSAIVRFSLGVLLGQRHGWNSRDVVYSKLWGDFA